MLKAQVIGYLGQDARVNTANGKNVINFTIAHTKKWKDAQGTEHSNTIWVDCAYWRDNTKISEFLKKGTQVHADGEPDVSMYKDKNGNYVPKLLLRVNDIQLLGGKKESGESTGTSAAAPVASDITQPVDDLPF